MGALDEHSRKRTIMGRIFKEAYSRIKREDYLRICAAGEDCGGPLEHVPRVKCGI